MPQGLEDFEFLDLEHFDHFVERTPTSTGGYYSWAQSFITPFLSQTSEQQPPMVSQPNPSKARKNSQSATPEKKPQVSAQKATKTTKPSTGAPSQPNKAAPTRSVSTPKSNPSNSASTTKASQPSPASTAKSSQPRSVSGTKISPLPSDPASKAKTGAAARSGKQTNNTNTKQQPRTTRAVTTSTRRTSGKVSGTSRETPVKGTLDSQADEPPATPTNNPAVSDTEKEPKDPPETTSIEDKKDTPASSQKELPPLPDESTAKLTAERPAEKATEKPAKSSDKDSAVVLNTTSTESPEENTVNNTEEDEQKTTSQEDTEDTQEITELGTNTAPDSTASPGAEDTSEAQGSQSLLSWIRERPSAVTESLRKAVNPFTKPATKPAESSPTTLKAPTNFGSLGVLQPESFPALKANLGQGLSSIPFDASVVLDESEVHPELGKQGHENGAAETTMDGFGLYHLDINTLRGLVVQKENEYAYLLQKYNEVVDGHNALVGKLNEQRSRRKEAESELKQIRQRYDALGQTHSAVCADYKLVLSELGEAKEIKNELESKTKELAKSKREFQQLQQEHMSSLDHYQPAFDDTIIDTFENLDKAIKSYVSSISKMKTALPEDAWDKKVANYMWSGSFDTRVRRSKSKEKTVQRKVLWGVVWKVLFDTLFNTPFHAFSRSRMAEVKNAYETLYPQPSKCSTVHPMQKL